MIGQRFEASRTFLIVLGIAVSAFGLLPGGNFFFINKPMPRWSGRLWFLAFGALLIYWGLTTGRR